MKEKEEARLLLLKEQENKLRKKGFEYICGIDEAAKTANVAQQKKNKNQTLSSLRVESSKVGASVGAGTPVGLNLGG